MEKKKFSIYWTILCVAPAACLGLENLFIHAKAGPAGIWFPSILQALGFIVPLVVAFVLAILNAVFFFRVRYGMEGFWALNFVITMIPLAVVFFA
jgi:hypothetical protein